VAWRLCPGFRTAARSLALKAVGVGEGAAEGEAVRGYRIRHAARSQADGPVLLRWWPLGPGSSSRWSKGPPGARVLVSSPQPQQGRDTSVPRRRREGSTCRHWWLLISLLFSLMAKDEEALVSKGRSQSCQGRRADPNPRLDQSIPPISLDASRQPRPLTG